MVQCAAKKGANEGCVVLCDGGRSANTLLGRLHLAIEAPAPSPPGEMVFGKDVLGAPCTELGTVHCSSLPGRRDPSARQHLGDIDIQMVAGLD